MSVNYATGLSHYPNKGVCGLPELSETAESLSEKVGRLAEWLRAARHVVVHTGAGVSTAAGVPDFRGPNGVWTLEQRGDKPQCSISFDDAAPTYTHMALCALENAGYVKFVVTQNVDGLHVRSGYPVDRLAELHGNVFAEACPMCRTRHIRPHVIASVGQKLTGAICGAPRPAGRKCRGRLRDTTLDWEHELPAEQLGAASEHCALADLSLCLGTSLNIQPANGLPLLAKKRTGGRLAVVNLQKTKMHAKADLAIHARVDEVMRRLCHILAVHVPEYEGPVLREHSIHTLRNGIKRDSTPPAKRRKVDTASSAEDSVSASNRDSAGVEGASGTAVVESDVKHELYSCVHSVVQQVCSDVCKSDVDSN